MTYFSNDGTPPYLQNGYSKKLQIFHAHRPREALTKQMQN